MEACSSSLMKTAVSFGGKKVVQAMEIFAFNKKKYETYVRWGRTHTLSTVWKRRIGEKRTTTYTLLYRPLREIYIDDVLRASPSSPAVLPKSDYLNVYLGSHLFLYYLYFPSNSSSTT